MSTAHSKPQENSPVENQYAELQEDNLDEQLIRKIYEYYRDHRKECNKYYKIATDIYEYRDISAKEVFLTFWPVYTIDDIAKALAHMLRHDFNGIWRRPIVYVSDVEDNETSDAEAKLRVQGINATLSANWDEDDFTKMTICDCGESYIKKIACDYEYYSVRVGNGKSLYSAKSVAEIEKITASIYDAVAKCCEKMRLFQTYYCEKKNLHLYEYLGLMFHPRTENGNPQLHTERVVFKHIEYLDNFRLYIAQTSQAFRPEEKEKIREILLNTIGKYLKLYNNKIYKLDPTRATVATDLANRLEMVETNPDDNTTRIRSW